MTTVFLVIHLMLAVALVTVILLQRSDGGALGGLAGGDAGGGFGNLLSGRQSANLLTRTTTIIATCFIITSLLLAILAARSSQSPSILDEAGDTEIAPIDYESPDEGPTAPIDE